MSSQSVLVLGGAGFIGSNFARHAIRTFESVVVFDKLTYAGNTEKLPTASDALTFVQGDVRDRGALREVYDEVDIVVNFAAESHVDRSIESGREFVTNNVEGCFVAMDLVRETDVDRFVQISTDEVYGSTTEGSFTESDPLDPSSPYSASKASADLFVNALWETYDLPISVVRPTNVYGPRQHVEKLIPKFTLRALRGEELPLYGDGSNVRQWLYVDDLCEALVAVLEDGDSTIYNVGGPDERSNLEVTNAILNHLGASSDLITFVEDRKGHDQRYSLDASRIRDELGFEPTVNFEVGIERTVNWYREHRDWYE
ncbi:dTDP-glucose 4,6-dehydratase [Natronomonas halophila]|uniref:dTDP-glucose 4,6-dehydratase n=1 Tax=Natronomonas halophila TaxID=2747817 RepID=UPI0015B430B2|nr:dTDP-glucose 4,6-dehydratase [Natronomonas halophila]QLD86839.1 dTDP-glucose 4,6-dehydratase [Natronomonas halophila]